MLKFSIAENAHRGRRRGQRIVGQFEIHQALHLPHLVWKHRYSIAANVQLYEPQVRQFCVKIRQSNQTFLAPPAPSRTYLSFMSTNIWHLKVSHSLLGINSIRLHKVTDFPRTYLLNIIYTCKQVSHKKERPKTTSLQADQLRITAIMIFIYVSRSHIKEADLYL